LLETDDVMINTSLPDDNVVKSSQFEMITLDFHSQPQLHYLCNRAIIEVID